MSSWLNVLSNNFIEIGLFTIIFILLLLFEHFVFYISYSNWFSLKLIYLAFTFQGLVL